MDFILDGVKLLSPDSMVSHAFTHNNKSALRPGAKNQIEAQLVKGLRKRLLYFLNCVPKITYLCSKLGNNETHTSKYKTQ